jgi:tetratricopeptide (TPR) repeat protein
MKKLLYVLMFLPILALAQEKPADSAALDARINASRKAEDWNTYVKLLDEKMKQTPPKVKGTALHAYGDSWGLNVYAWDVFINCNDKAILSKALEWINQSIEIDQPVNVQYLDTKANILYKLGRVKEGIEVEQKAYDMVVEQAKKAGAKPGGLADTYLKVIEQMKRGEPTYVNENAVWNANTMPVKTATQ